jgi:hypothetical protein
MIFGVTLKHFGKLQRQGDDVKESKWLLHLLNKPQVDKFKTRQLQDLTYSDYVDLKRYKDDKDFYNFCRIFVIIKWWQVIYIHHTTAIMTEYARQQEEIFDRYYYYFKPPQYGEPAKVTPGSELRSDFVLEFGYEVIVIDIVMRWANCSYKDLEKWKTNEVFFWGHFLRGQKIVEEVT